MFCTEVIVAGAMYCPFGLMAPTFGDRDHVTTAGVVPYAALSCSACPAVSVVSPGLTTSKGTMRIAPDEIPAAGLVTPAVAVKLFAVTAWPAFDTVRSTFPY